MTSRARDEAGFTLVEVIIAALIVAVTALAVLSAVDAATRNTFRAQQSQALNSRLQSEIEKIKQLPYGQVALTSAPSHATDPKDPNYRVSGTQFNIASSPNAPAVNQSLVYNGGVSHDQGISTVSAGTVAPGPTPFQSGGVKGKIYRYVTWQQDASCTSCGSPWVRHLTVIATLDTTAAGGVRAYQELQSDLDNPTANSSSGGPPGGGTDATPWTFWLTDTSCDNNSRQPITGDHDTHNTRGACSAGQPSPGQNVPQAPDLMLTEAPPCANNDCSSNQPLYDYAKDVEPAQNPDNDRGVQLRNGPACSALQSTWNTLPLLPDLFDTTYYQKVHKWVSRPIPNNYDILFNGNGVLDIWTESINGAVQPGQICAYIFYRQTSTNILGQTVVVDVPAVNLDLGNATYFTYSASQWPTTWTELHIPLHFNLGAHLLPGTRLGLALSIDGSGNPPHTGTGGLEFLYDAPSFDSRVQLQTTSVVPF